MPLKWEGICFDLDNTLFSHEEAFQYAIKACYEKYLSEINVPNCDITFGHFFSEFKANSDRYWGSFENKQLTGKEYRRIRFNKTMESLQLPFSNEHADAFHAHYYQIVDEYSVPYPGMKELLSTLSKREVKLGIITNGMADTQLKKIKKLGVDQWIHNEHIIISEEVEFVKPSREIFRIAEKRLQIHAEQLVFIGDSWKHDVEGALNSGWDAIFLNSRNEVKRNVRAKLTAEFKTLEEVKRFILEEEGRGVTV
ncbi:HAD family hydrolase [Bacillus shivajii]|uniref:HAD family hydrolase n=1 Tax=Bacillus shivajii TaxID=1983719 RepID=UPI001CFBCE4C|nr:HAD family hydrolase [Bacillus shivajii]UCZ54554.1 HAD family hydrolase [Bacillus shivajii]